MAIRNVQGFEYFPKWLYLYCIQITISKVGNYNYYYHDHFVLYPLSFIWIPICSHKVVATLPGYTKTPFWGASSSMPPHFCTVGHRFPVGGRFLSMLHHMVFPASFAHPINYLRCFEAVMAKALTSTTSCTSCAAGAKIINSLYLLSTLSAKN